MSRSFIVACAAASALTAVQPASADPFVRLDDYGDQELQVVGFELPRAVKAKVAAVGLEGGTWSWSSDDHDGDRRDRRRSRRTFRWGGDDHGPLATAWLVESATRKVVWSQGDAKTVRDRDRRDRDDGRWTTRFEDEIELAPGRYELYAWAGTNWGGGGIQIFGLRDLRHVVGDRRGFGGSRMRRAFRDCSVELSAEGVGEGDVPRFTPTGEIPGTLYRATGLGDEAFVRASFRLDRAANVRVYALIEMPHDWRTPADGGYIVNAETRERIWEIHERDLDDAGGSRKNRIYDREIQLEPGRYEICFGTDASHSTEEWNAAPPHDPLNWGLTLLPGKNFDASAFHLESEVARGEPVVDLTRARDDDAYEKGFRLGREVDVHVYALGEWDEDNDEFADGGWITDARTGRVVWEMTERNTTAAGGAEKNRMFDGVVRLPAGDYVAHYETDGSHAYRDWNADAPWDRNAWGLALYPGRGVTAADIQPSDVTTADATAAGDDLLVSMVRVRDDEHRRERFELATQTRVRIRALGEGDRGELYDYAWIEDDRGRVVWEMTERNTRHAGGARKNRLFDDVVLLDAGRYEVHYVTDDSHAYRSWNARRPREPEAWGVTITRADR